MTLPLLAFTNNCCGIIPEECCGIKIFRGKLMIASFTFDLLAAITCSVLSILAFTAVISLPPAATYSLLGFSVGTLLLYALACCCPTGKTEGNK